MLKAATLLVLTLAALSAPHSSYAGTEVANLSAVSKKEGYCLAKLIDANDCFEAQLDYPVFWHAALDQNVRAWAKRFFAQEVTDLERGCAEITVNPERRWKFAATPQVFSAHGAISIKFDIYYDTGGAHPNHAVRTLTLDTEGKALGYEDLFLKTEGLWKFLSKYAKAALHPTLKEYWHNDPSLVQHGLAPKAKTFQYFVVTPYGLTLIFPRYQVAPHVAGEQHCDVPLKALERFSPKPGIWDKGE